jgi:hypothetical protein
MLPSIALASVLPRLRKRRFSPFAAAISGGRGVRVDHRGDGGVRDAGTHADHGGADHPGSRLPTLLDQAMAAVAPTTAT